MPRENGFYWVRYRDEWVPAEHRDGEWWIVGLDTTFREAEFDKIGAKIEAPPIS